MHIETLRIAGIDKPVARIALGTWSMGGHLWGGADNEQSIRTIRHALNCGINLIDSAPVYGLGLCETLIGKALRGQRHSAVIATKAGVQWDDGSPWRQATAQRIRKAVEDSLVRLETDYIDLYQARSLPSAPATALARTSTISAGIPRWPPYSRRTTCLSAPSTATFCRMPSNIRWWCWPMARYAVAC
jgi:aryl-alcohol dehydrogenase-like predicted oxidoreductase